ncbi:enolase C-terminal domain-like protein [Streptomyces sp. TS71-3]|uniref:enolase C-terminal domain-like protein n=1 Tax=Streptomyces sp. TS71-3 TaxID=2733862 RepID=UPI001B1C9177|nr:enolase C-terminal domain-like protein [Streptomyces sp. TS71-3]GHJ42406.1 bifunctional D-altronate/D-mannonate dehydratase [Streptomyces sp. TS71-3]
MAQPDASADLLAPAPWVEERGAKIRITAVRTFLTAPHGCPHLIVRIETNDPGLYGLGCASDPQRTLAVRSVLDDYVAPMLAGRDPDDIEDIHRLLLNSAYWRGGSVTGNALGGVDVALWDLKAKRLGAPLYSLFGGRVRTGAAAYTHVDGADAEEIADKVAAAREHGFDHVRIQAAVPGADTYGSHGAAVDPAAVRARRVPWDSAGYLRTVPAVLARVREIAGDGVELLHDVHERLDPRQAREFLRRVADVGLYFVEDLLAPEDAGHFARLHAVSPVPLAVGELFHDTAQFLPLLDGPAIDFARIRIPTLGGLTPARKIAAVCELRGVRLAPHGPADVSPIAQAATLALDISSHAFGVQEAATFKLAAHDVYPGTIVPQGGSLVPRETPGHGVDFDETAARRHPVPEPLGHDRWALLRNTDGSVQRP